MSVHCTLIWFAHASFKLPVWYNLPGPEEHTNMRTTFGLWHGNSSGRIPPRRSLSTTSNCSSFKWVYRRDFSFSFRCKSVLSLSMTSSRWRIRNGHPDSEKKTLKVWNNKLKQDIEILQYCCSCFLLLLFFVLVRMLLFFVVVVLCIYVKSDVSCFCIPW